MDMAPKNPKSAYLPAKPYCLACLLGPRPPANTSPHQLGLGLLTIGLGFVRSNCFGPELDPH